MNTIMIIIVGLGNPGKKYLDTRHNVGFQTIDEFIWENNFPELKLSKKFNALVSESIINGKKIILAKPQTFMNNSGKSVKTLFSFYKPKELIIVHDDIDLPLGKIRISKNKGSAGHKGVESIIKEIGTKDFTRFRIGILPKTGKPKNTERYVLQKLNKEEEKLIKQVIQEITTEIKKKLS